MRFFIDQDDGHAIRGWVVPDNPLAVSRVAVAVEGRRVAEVPSAITDEVFQRNGWHATGQCIFLITEADVPGLQGLPRLELYDADTNVLLHRRVPADGLTAQRVFLIGTGIEPDTALEGALFPCFQRAYLGVEKLSEEVVSSIFIDSKGGSILLSGAIVVPRYENYLTPDLMITGILVQDPLVEMARRILWLRARADEAADPARSWRLGRLAEAAAFTAEHDLADARSLKRFFRMLPEPAYHLLYNPLTRQLGTRMPDDRLHPGNSIAAIEVLSRIAIVGHGSRFGAFASTLFDRLGLDLPVPALPEIPAETQALVERLRAVKAVEEMIVFDVAMSDAVKASVDKSWG